MFLLAKNERYHYDANAIREPYANSSYARYGYPMRDVTPDRHKPGVRNRVSKESRTLNPLGRHARNVWQIGPANFRGAHFAVMPVALASRCVLAGSTPGDMVLDPFGGAGTSAIAANNHGRDATLIELNPEYAELARKRLSSDTMKRDLL